jgi:pilus assembly protein FimV
MIRLNTEQPFRDPFLHLIINAKWANGSMLREYTALLDPPSYLTGAPASIQAPMVAKVVDVLPPLPPAVDKTKKPSASRSAVDVPTSAADVEDSKLGPAGIGVSADSDYSDLRPGSTYGPVKTGDALWDIAEKVKPGEQLGIAQVMMAIYKQNPDAFLKNNINLIRVGKTLQIPSDSDISSTPLSVAQEELRVQMEVWQEYKDNLSAGGVVARTGTDDVIPDKAASVKEDAEPKGVADDKEEAREPGKGETDVLEIVRAKVDGAKSTGSAADAGERAEYEAAITVFKEKASLLEESLASSELEKQELAARVALLEEQIDKANKLIDMQNTELALLQSKGQAGAAAPEGAVSESPELSAPDIAPIAPVAPKVEKPKVVEKPPVTEKKAAKSRVRPKPVEEKGLLDTVMDSIASSWVTMLGAGLALLLVLIGLFVVLRRRRSIAEFEDSIISGTAVLDMSTAVSTEPTDSSGASEASFLSDFVPGMGNMQADEVDPLAEAEVYMAYGRDEQAEEVLKEAAANNPDRHELKLKLLEIYQSRKDVSSFETLAEELYPADGNIPMDIWARVAEMGKTLNPENPLFQGELKVKEDTLFGDKERKEAGELGDLLDTTSSINTKDVAEQATDEITQELYPDSGDLSDMEGIEVPEDTLEIPEQGDVAEGTKEKAGDFPVPEEEVLDLDLGDFSPDEAQETDSFDLDTLGLNLDDLGGDIEESDAQDKGEIDYNLDGIDLDLGEVDTEDTADAALADTLDMSELELKDLNLDLESEDNAVASDSETTEVPLQDETLEFADLGDLTLTGTESDSDADTTGSGAVESSAKMPAGANEADTKLDLARAYIEMDDKESAQNLLEEVATEGTDYQKNEARDLMHQISAG